VTEQENPENHEERNDRKEFQEEGLEIAHLIFKENNINCQLFHKEFCQHFQEME
jgi:hypothetical protein